MADFDVLIVGAGPSGSTAAKRLGEAGARVLLLEKANSFPREKPCGGGLSARILNRFPYLRDILSEIGTNPIRRVYMESPDGTGVAHEQADPIMYLVRRWEFDAALFHRAQKLVPCELGVTIRALRTTANGVELETTNGRVFHGKMVLGCDSANSVIARHSGLRIGDIRSEYAVDMMEETPVATLRATRPDTISLFLTLTRTFGYGYIFPKTKHLNLGFGCRLDYYLDELRGKGKEHHAEWVDQLRQKCFVVGETQPAGYKAFPIPISGPLAKTFTDRVLLAGDAGGFVNAFTAEGIFYAMTSGELAADTALAAIKADDFSARKLALYERAWKAEIGDDLEHSFMIQRRLFDGSGRTDQIMHAATRDPKLTRLVIGYSMGSERFEDLRNYMAASTVPRWVMGKVKRVLGFGNNPPSPSES